MQPELLIENIPPEMLEMVDRLRTAFTQVNKTYHREQTLAGLKKAKQEGRAGGRPQKLSADQRKKLMAMLSAGESIVAISVELSISPPTVYSYIRRQAQSL